MPRVFTGIELPADIRLRLSLLRAPLGGGHWIDADDMHLTLRFAGDIDDSAADMFAEELDRIAFEPFEFRIAGTGAFGGPKPTAVYADIEANPALQQLFKAHDRAARAAGLDPQPHAFKPHVTLARLRSGRPVPVAQFLETSGDLRLGPITVHEFALFSARPGSGGGPYAVEARFPAGD